MLEQVLLGSFFAAFKRLSLNTWGLRTSMIDREVTLARAQYSTGRIGILSSAFAVGLH